MLYFPQLTTGAIGQFPFTKRARSRTLVNRMEDGREIRMADPNGGETVWELRLTGLTDGERQAIEDLFRAANGRAEEFVFLDPSANLLRWSGDFTASVWTAGPALALAPGIADPQGTTLATRITNAGQAAQRITQTLEIPADLWYCVSAIVRSASGTQIGLVRGDQTDLRAAGPQWQNVQAAGNAAGSGENIAFGLEIPAGESVDLFGMQVDAQPAASGYKRSGGESGTHLAHFAEDRLVFVAEAPGSYGVRIRVVGR